MAVVSNDLPGHELVAAGLADVDAGRQTEAALLVRMAGPRLRRLGFLVPEAGGVRAAHELYDLLSEADPATAHSRYNALTRRILSFARAAEHASAG